jgi:hypothetical protein
MPPLALRYGAQMNKSKITEKQLRAAEQYILLRRSAGNSRQPEDQEQVQMSWQHLVMLVAEYGAIRAGSVAKGGSVDEPGEVYLTGK